MMDIDLLSRPDPAIMQELGQRLRALRKASGWNQSEVADRAGLDRTTVSRAERGDNPTLLTLIRLLRVFDRLDALDAFIPVPTVSPLAVVSASKTRGPSEGRTGHDPPEAREGQPTGG